MGVVAGRLSDVIVITSDNPRSEDPGRIIEEIQRGITPDTRRDSGQRAAGDRRSPRGDRQGDRDRAARRSRADRRQGTREVPGDRRPRAAVRRRRGGARGAGAAAHELGRGMTPAWSGAAIPLIARWVADETGGVVVRGDREREFAACRSTRGRLRPATCSSAFAASDSTARVRRRGDRGRRGWSGGAARLDGGIREDVARGFNAPRAGERPERRCGRHRSRRHDQCAAGAWRTCSSAGIGNEGRGDHRQRRQDHDQGSDERVSRGAIPGDSQPREPEQPHRAAAVAHRAEAAAGDRRRRTGDEPCR